MKGVSIHCWDFYETLKTFYLLCIWNLSYFSHSLQIFLKIYVKKYWKAWNIIVIFHNGWNCFVLGAIEAISQLGRRLCFLKQKNVIIHQFCKFSGFMNLLCAYLFFFSGMLLVRNPTHPCFKGPCMISTHLLLLFFKILPRFAFNIPNISSFLCNLLFKLLFKLLSLLTSTRFLICT